MQDNHVHFGTWHNLYYDPVEIIDIVLETCSSLVISSTTSCVERVEYKKIEKEYNFLFKNKDYLEKIKPLFWVCPHFFENKESIETYMTSVPYIGFKIHSLSNAWNLSSLKHVQLLNEIFQYAEENNKPIIIHTGHSRYDHPYKFHDFFESYPDVRVVLAHCNNYFENASLLDKNSMLLNDTAFASKKEIKELIKRGFQERVIFGSDFPITHYYKQIQTKKNISLREQYKEDVKIFKKYKLEMKNYF